MHELLSLRSKPFAKGPVYSKAAATRGGAAVLRSRLGFALGCLALLWSGQGVAAREEAHPDEAAPSEASELFASANEARLEGRQRDLYENAGGKAIQPHKRLVAVQRSALDDKAIVLNLFEGKSAWLELQKQEGEPVWKGRSRGMIRFSLRETSPGHFGGYLLHEDRRYVIYSVGEGLAAFYEEVEENFSCGVVSHAKEGAR